ncbi:MAG: hypothetical protein HONDAALG_00442 [Gammaproteobacteria bacterium]|nr:hypothetical protein [Gammaproteobacteria bacterium]
MTGDNEIAFRLLRVRHDDQRFEHAFLPDGIGQFLNRRRVNFAARVVGMREEQVNRAESHGLNFRCLSNHKFHQELIEPFAY